MLCCVQRRLYRFIKQVFGDGCSQVIPTQISKVKGKSIIEMSKINLRREFTHLHPANSSEKVMVMGELYQITGHILSGIISLWMKFIATQIIRVWDMHVALKCYFTTPSVAQIVFVKFTIVVDNKFSALKVLCLLL